MDRHTALFATRIPIICPKKAIYPPLARFIGPSRVNRLASTQYSWIRPRKAVDAPRAQSSSYPNIATIPTPRTQPSRTSGRRCLVGFCRLTRTRQVEPDYLRVDKSVTTPILGHISYPQQGPAHASLEIEHLAQVHLRYPLPTT